MPSTMGSARFNGEQTDHSVSQNSSSSGGKGIIRINTQRTIVSGGRKEKGPHNGRGRAGIKPNTTGIQIQHSRCKVTLM